MAESGSSLHGFQQHWVLPRYQQHLPPVTVAAVMVAAVMVPPRSATQDQEVLPPELQARRRTQGSRFRQNLILPPASKGLQFRRCPFPYLHLNPARNPHAANHPPLLTTFNCDSILDGYNLPDHPILQSWKLAMINI